MRTLLLPAFYLGAGHPDEGLHAFTARTRSSELLSQPQHVTVPVETVFIEGTG